MAEVASVNWSNQEVLEQHEQETAGRQAEQYAEQLEHATTKQWLETKLDEQATPHEIFGREFYFRPIGSQKVEEILKLASEEASTATDVDADSLDDIDPEDMSELPKLLRAMREMLGEHCLDEEMDAEAFGMLPMEELQNVFESVADGGELTESQRQRARNFRG